jgi:fructose transport system permease protein
MASDTSGGTTTAQPDLPTGFDENKSESMLNRIQHVLHANPILGPLAVLIVAIIAFAIVNGRFLSAANLGLVLQQVTVIATIALGQTLIILTAGIDLSAGAIAVFTSILMANMAVKLGVPGVVAIIIGLILGTLMGAINGLLVTRINLPPFIVTLATLSIYFSLNSVVSRSETIRGSDMPSIMTATGNNAFRIGGFSLTWGTIIMLLLFAIFFYSLGSTSWGKHVYATGDDVEAARLAGIRTDRVLLSVYLVAGLIYAIGAWVLMGRLASASPNVGTEYNLNSITAVVLGGTSLLGGRGTFVGTLLGAGLIVQVFNAMVFLDLSQAWQYFFQGGLIVAAAVIYSQVRRTRT